MCTCTMTPYRHVFISSVLTLRDAYLSIFQIKQPNSPTQDIHNTLGSSKRMSQKKKSPLGPLDNKRFHRNVANGCEGCDGCATCGTVVNSAHGCGLTMAESWLRVGARRPELLRPSVPLAVQLMVKRVKEHVLVSCRSDLKK